MKVITTNLLNRFWKNGIKPMKEELKNKLDTSKIVASTNISEAGKVMDGKTVSEELIKLDVELGYTFGKNNYGYYKKYNNGILEMWGIKSYIVNIQQNNSPPYWSLDYQIDFPIKSVETCTCNVDFLHNGVVWGSLSSGADNKNYARFRLYAISPYSNFTINCNWRAIGQWK